MVKVCNLVFALFAASMLTACAGFERLPPNADFGPYPREEEYRSQVEQRITDRLIDPESARFRFGAPVRGYANQGLIHGGRIASIGYIIPVEVNAKNRLGGYVGFTPYFCLFSRGFVSGCEQGSYRGHPLVTVVP